MAELKNRFLYVSAELWNGFTTEQKAAYNNSIVFVKNGNDGVAIYTQGATFGTLDEVEVKTIIESYDYLKTTDFNTAKGLLEQAIADAKSGAISDANAYTDGQIEIVTKAIADKNVSAEGDEYVSATAEGNKVIVAATESTKASLALADTAVQSVVTGETNGTIKVDDKEVAVAGLGSAAYTDSTAYDAAGAASTVKTELLGDVTEAGNTLGKLEDRIETIVSDAKTYEVKKLTTEELAALGNENVKEAFKLVDEDGTQAGETINIYKDSSLVSIELVDADKDGNAGQFLKYVYVLANGNEETVYVDANKFLVQSEFKNGLQVSDAGEVSVKVDGESESYLTVGANGIKVSGIDAIKTTADTAVQSAEGNYVTVTKEGTKLTFTTTTKEVATATADADGLATAFDVKSYVENAVSTNTNGLNSELSADSQYFTKVVITNGKLDEAKSTKANISEAVLTNYVTTSTDKYVGIVATDTINGAFDKVERAWDWAEITA